MNPTLLLRTYEMVFHGKNLSEHPATYPWWMRLHSYISGRYLPRTIHSNRVKITTRVQGTSPDMMDEEFEHRKRWRMDEFRLKDPSVQLATSALICEQKNHTGRPLLDRAPGQSPRYQEWLARYVTTASDTSVNDTEDYSSVNSMV